MQKDYDLKSIYNITSKNFSLSKYKVEIMGIYERIIYLVIGNALKSTSSMYSYLARISTYIGTYHLTLIRCRKCNWSHVSSILTVPTNILPQYVNSIHMEARLRKQEKSEWGFDSFGGTTKFN